MEFICEHVWSFSHAQPRPNGTIFITEGYPFSSVRGICSKCSRLAILVVYPDEQSELHITNNPFSTILTSGSVASMIKDPNNFILKIPKSDFLKEYFDYADLWLRF